MDISPLNPAEKLFGLLQDNRQIPLVPVEGEDEEKLLDACRNFEAIFVRQMLKEMRKTVPKDGFIPESMESNVFTSMFDEEVSKQISLRGRMGLAEMMFQQLLNNPKTPAEGNNLDE